MATYRLLQPTCWLTVSRFCWSCRQITLPPSKLSCRTTTKSPPDSWTCWYKTPVKQMSQNIVISVSNPSWLWPLSSHSKTVRAPPRYVRGTLSVYWISRISKVVTPEKRWTRGLWHSILTHHQIIRPITSIWAQSGSDFPNRTFCSLPVQNLPWKSNEKIVPLSFMNDFI